LSQESKFVKIHFFLKKTLLYVIEKTLSIVRRVRKIAKTDCLLRNACLSAHPSSHQSDLRELTDFYEIRYLSNFRKSVENILVSLKSDKKNECLRLRPTYLLTITREILLRMRNVSDKTCIENHNTHFTFSNTFL
jgi:hypothetical protein